MADSGEVEFGYWNRWQVPVCALVIFVPTLMVAGIMIPKEKRAPRLRVIDLWVPCWRGLSPVWLLIYRASALSIMCGLLIVGILIDGETFITYFYAVAASSVLYYFAFATIVSARGCWQLCKTSATTDEESYELQSCRGINKSRGQNDEEEIEHSISFFEETTEFMYQVSAVAVLTGIVFWGLLVPFQSGDNFILSVVMGLMHTVNMAFLLLDTILNKLSFPWYRIPDIMLWSCGYIILEWVLHACGITWLPNPFLELSTPWAPLRYFAFVLVHVLCYGAYALIVKAKYYAFSAFFPREFVSV